MLGRQLILQSENNQWADGYFHFDLSGVTTIALLSVTADTSTRNTDSSNLVSKLSGMAYILISVTVNLPADAPDRNTAQLVTG